MSSHLEDLIAEFYDWRGYLVKRNIMVGKRALGGWDMELDLVAYHPHTKHLIHVESSLDAHSWDKRVERFQKKFSLGEKFMFDEVFTWLDKSTQVDKVAVLISHPSDRHELCGARIASVDEMMAEVRDAIERCGKMSKDAISEQYPLLRTVQLAIKGYYRVVPHVERPGNADYKVQ